MALLIFEQPLKALTFDNLNNLGVKIATASSSLWRGFKVKVIDLATEANSAEKNSIHSKEHPLTFSIVAQAVKKSAERLLKACIIGVGYLHLSAVHLWNSFLLKRETSHCRQKVQTWIYLSPKGCLLSATVAALVASFAMATFNESHKKRWLGYAGLSCTAVAIAYFA